MKSPIFFLVPAVLLTLAACDRKPVVVIDALPMTPVPKAVAQTRTIETARVRESIDAFERAPTGENLADANKAFAQLDSEIAELEAYIAKHSGQERAEAAAKLKNLTAYRAAEAIRFSAAQAKSNLPSTAPADPRTGADKVEDSAKEIGRSIENAAKNIGDAVKDVVR